MMILEQFYLECLSQASYLIGDTDSKIAAVIDPRRDVEIYTDFADAHDLTIHHVIETHVHADFLSGHLELAKTTGAEIVFGSKAAVEFAFRGVSHGERLSIGPSVTLEFLETPGHTPESICVLVSVSGKPHAVLTGDSLFIGDVGRPDLLASSNLSAEYMAEQLYVSLHDEILSLPDDVLVLPGHGAGSACGKALSSETRSTIGAERKTNYALADISKNEFVSLLTHDLMPAPPYFEFDADQNRRERDVVELAPIHKFPVSGLANTQHQILDCRDPLDFAHGHLPGAINISLDSRFAETAGSILSPTESVLIFAPNREGEARMRLARIGFDHVVGALSPEEVFSQESLLQRSSRLSYSELKQVDTQIIDVRTPTEFEAGHLPNARNIPLSQFQTASQSLGKEQTYVINCAGGVASSSAASYLIANGFADVSDLLGGYNAVRNEVA